MQAYEENKYFLKFSIPEGSSNLVERKLDRKERTGKRKVTNNRWFANKMTVEKI